MHINRRSGAIITGKSEGYLFLFHRESREIIRRGLGLALAADGALIVVAEGMCLMRCFAAAGCADLPVTFHINSVCRIIGMIYCGKRTRKGLAAHFAATGLCSGGCAGRGGGGRPLYIVRAEVFLLIFMLAGRGMPVICIIARPLVGVCMLMCGGYIIRVRLSADCAFAVFKVMSRLILLLIFMLTGCGVPVCIRVMAPLIAERMFMRGGIGLSADGALAVHEIMLTVITLFIYMLAGCGMPVMCIVGRPCIGICVLMGSGRIVFLLISADGALPVTSEGVISLIRDQRSMCADRNMPMRSLVMRPIG